MKAQLVANPAEFDQAIRYLRETREIALDLEFDNNRYTYGLTLCLIQVADRSRCFLIDPLAVKNLDSFWKVLEDKTITKIFHSSTSDILLLKTLGCYPRNLLDTEIAAKILNYSETSLAYALSVNLGVELDKTLQVSNWNTRPLSPEQLLYAEADVAYLHELKDRLLSELERVGRLHWLEEECYQLELIESRENLEPHLRLREANRLTIYQQFVLKALYNFRDQLGRTFNKPSAFIIPNDVLVALAIKPAISFDDWNTRKGFYRTVKERAYYTQFKHTVEIAEAEAKRLNIPHRLPPPFRRAPATIPEAEIEKRKVLGARLRKALAEKYGENAASLVLSQGAIQEFCNGSNLIVRKHYAGKAIIETADELSIDPEQLHLEVAAPE